MDTASERELVHLPTELANVFRKPGNVAGHKEPQSAAGSAKPGCNLQTSEAQRAILLSPGHRPGIGVSSPHGLSQPEGPRYCWNLVQLSGEGHAVAILVPPERVSGKSAPQGRRHKAWGFDPGRRPPAPEAPKGRRQTGRSSHRRYGDGGLVSATAPTFFKSPPCLPRPRQLEAGFPEGDTAGVALSPRRRDRRSAHGLSVTSYLSICKRIRLPPPPEVTPGNSLIQLQDRRTRLKDSAYISARISILAP